MGNSDFRDVLTDDAARPAISHPDAEIPSAAADLEHRPIREQLRLRREHPLGEVVPRTLPAGMPCMPDVIGGGERVSIGHAATIRRRR